MEKNALSIYYIIIIIIIMAMLITGVFFLLATFSSGFRERVIVKKQAKSLVKGDRLIDASKNIKKKLFLKGKIRVKFILFSLILVVFLTFFGGSLIGYRVVQMVKRNLADELNNRLELLMNSLASGISYYMPSNKILEIEGFTEITKNIEEVKSVTILGPKLHYIEDTGRETFDYVWYTDDPNIRNKVDDYLSGSGYMKYVASDSFMYRNIISDINIEIHDYVIPLILEQEYCNKQLLKIIDDEEDYTSDEITEIQKRYFELDDKINECIAKTKKMGFLPDYNPEKIDLSVSEYTLYQPIIYRTAESTSFVHGIILITFTTDKLKTILDESIQKIHTVAIFFCIVANIIAIVGAFIMATVITKPINELEEHLKRVGLTKDRTKLDKLQINITSKDEIGRLGLIVNEMTKQLGAAAKEEQLMVDAKSVQQAFLPLAETESGMKRNIAFQKSDKIDFFGYFEGAATVSGDYFDYKQLDKDWHVAVKCDASGHGFAAAIIMTIIATLFRNYFNQWSYDNNGIGINHFINQVNQFISKLNINGRFASMLVCLINSRTGELYMCNAGDNLVHIYDSVLKKIKTIELFSSPVVGPFNSVLINQMGGFKVEKIMLKPGDMLILYTDGIEESFRVCRKPNYDPIEVEGDLPGSKKVKYEVFGQKNILNVIEAVLNKETFILDKIDNPDTREILEFDFTNCPGSVEDVVTAVASVEKIFRMYKPSSALKTDFVSVDKQIDHFLKKYFKMYNEYCINKADSTDDYVFSNYIDYEFVMEDEQKDDLTFFVVKYC